MQKRTLVSILLVVVFSLTLASATFATHPGEPEGSCPTGFELQHVGDHDHEAHDQEMPHTHVGLDSDLNGDGYWCVKHVTRGQQHIHVHVDNDRPL